MDINWYPGHMAKAMRDLRANLSKVDAAAILLDARIPLSSQNPDLDSLLENKPHLVVLNKSDLADPVYNEKWLRYFKERNIPAILSDSRDSKCAKSSTAAARELLREKIEKSAAKGAIGKAIKVMVVGIPNVGKSTFINNLAGTKRAKAEDRPGVTRAKQWISLGNGLDLMDTPGVLWGRIEDPVCAKHLAYTGAINDNILDTIELSCLLLEKLAAEYPSALSTRYKLPSVDGSGLELLEAIAKKRGFIISGGELDHERAAAIVLDEFRGGKIGRVTLDRI